MGSGGGGISREDQEAANQQAQHNFELSHGLSEAQFLWQQEQAALAQARENERRANIQESTNRINSAFEEREPIFERLENATFDLNKDSLDDSKTAGSTDLTYGLARAGLSGGQVDIHKNEEINDRYNDGLILARNNAIGAGNSARANDASIKNNLLAAASTGNFNGQQLLDSSRGSLRAINNTPAAVAPDLQGNTFFADIANSLGGLSYDLARANNNGARFGGSINHTPTNNRASSNYYGSVRGLS